ncbi:MAG TPA: GAF domain-containing sensor histidine kinase [Oscillatoriaceae cyanobacterium M33_DOE_052]|uniref:histidine kinase n=1 Tax=Planktothricoides sp. SpSt-374 TaxID=2282167 RepID=A0A7C3ZPV6_9CYAN|nr:GAF domain-containing sensor histidine kinase [Oscillatoriaceae cyanobacterium M33_DOE_052]
MQKAGKFENLLLLTVKQIQQQREVEEIWRQTVESLGTAIGVSRCMILPYKDSSALLEVVAEYRQEGCTSLLGRSILDAEAAEVEKAILSGEPLIVEQFSQADLWQRQSMLVVGVRYMDQPLGAIVLHQCNFPHHWLSGEIAFVQEVAEQVGFCIAHANLKKRLEEARALAQEAYRTKANFLSCIDDQLRNPLNGIIGSLKLILDDIIDDPEEQRSFIQDAHASAMGLFNIINDILHFAKLKAGKLDLELGQPVSLTKLLHNVDRFARPPAEHKHLYLRIELPTTYEEVIIYGNELRLLQVLLNLAGNAIKFTHTGGVIITAVVRLGEVTVGDRTLPGMVEITITDTGIGVPLEYQSRVFEPFFQVHDPRTSPYPGTGLGLAISQKLVEQMGGKMQLYSMGQNMGATVIITLPILEAKS